MEGYYVVLVFGIISSVSCSRPRHEGPPCHPPDGVFLPTYGLVLLLVAMVIELAAIIYLAIALTRKSRLINVTDNRVQFQYSRDQPCIDDIYSRNNESNYTVNSGIISVSRDNIHDTPTQSFSEVKIYVKKPTESMQIMHKKQMDEILARVLSRSNKSASTSMRELNAIQNEIKHGNTLQVEDTNNKAKEINSPQASEDDNKNEEECGIKTSNKENLLSSINTKDKETNEVVDGILKTPHSLEIDSYDILPSPKTPTEINKNHYSPVEQEVYYDQLPTESNGTNPDELYDTPPDNNGKQPFVLYDCPPTNLEDDELPQYSECLVMVDSDTDYKLILSRRETGSYVNARSQKKVSKTNEDTKDKSDEQ